MVRLPATSSRCRVRHPAIAIITKSVVHTGTSAPGAALRSRGEGKEELL
jgi:hypothetical protein